MVSVRQAPQSLMARALQWLAGREHSRQELRAKLLRWSNDPEAPTQVDAVLDQLAARGQLSEARFVESRVRVRASRFGNRRIEQELRQHGLAPDAAAREDLRRTELARAREVWRKKYGQIAGTPAERARQARFLTSRGFSSDVVRQLILHPDDHESA